MSGNTAANQPIPLPSAAKVAGIPARTLRNWIASGKLAAIRGQRGWLVRLGDIAHIAAMIDNHAASEIMADGMADGLAAELAGPTAEDAGCAATTASHAAITATAQHAQAEALVQQILAPFIAEQTRLAEELGHVKAERDDLRRRAEEAEAERDRLTAAQEGLESTETLVVVEEAAPSVWGRLRRWWARR